jgi:hypothetical protein
MFCFRIKRKLYGLIEGRLSEGESLKIRAHLEKCSSCNREFQQMCLLLGLVSQKETPKMSKEFWSDFQAQLDRRLSQEKPKPVPEFKFRYYPRLSPRPAFALAFALVLIILISSYLFQMIPLGENIRLAKTDEEFLNALILSEELGQILAPAILDEEAFLEEEIELLCQLDPTFAL